MLMEHTAYLWMNNVVVSENVGKTKQFSVSKRVLALLS
jgi:hypothetical protein